jgi:cell division septation protein DedD
MTDEKGRVHYQLSITGGQAGAFFLALLVALCLAFFFGMKTGSASRRAPDNVARLSAASDIAVPASPDAEGADAGATATKRRLAPTEPPLGFDETPAVKPPVRGEAETPTAAPRRAQHPTATPAPKPVPPTVPAPSAPRTTAPEPAGAWFVQVLATQKPETADETAKKLKTAGYSSDVSPVPDKPGLFRVRVGPYRDRASAEEAAARVARDEKWLRSAKPIVIPGSK